jgi:glycerol-3-phosphate acyltransferase PlsY
MLVLAGLIFWTHRENIKRLRAGNERRFGEKTLATAPVSKVNSKSTGN